jgi:ABC-type Fe3+/spermidine/putrescine transport system ATPase subunit
MNRDIVLRAQNLTKQVSSPEGTLTIVRDVTLAIERRETVAIVGPSGAGKSTLRALLAGLDVPTSGEVWLAGAEISRLDEDGRAALRAAHVGFVFQSFHLVPSLTRWRTSCCRSSFSPAGDARRRCAAERASDAAATIRVSSPRRAAARRFCAPSLAALPSCSPMSPPQSDADGRAYARPCSISTRRRHHAGARHARLRSRRAATVLTMDGGEPGSAVHLLLLAVRSPGPQWRSGEVAVLLAPLNIAVAARGRRLSWTASAAQRQASEVLAQTCGWSRRAAGWDRRVRREFATARLTTLPNASRRFEPAGECPCGGRYGCAGISRLRRSRSRRGASRRSAGAGDLADSPAATLGARVGDDQHRRAYARVARILISRSDQGSAFVELAPALLERCRHRLDAIAAASRAPRAVAGEAPVLQRFRDCMRRSIPRLRLADVATPARRSAMPARGALLALAAWCRAAGRRRVAMSARSYVRRHLDSVALLKTLGVCAASCSRTGRAAVPAGRAATTSAAFGWLTQSWLLHALTGRGADPPAVSCR